MSIVISEIKLEEKEILNSFLIQYLKELNQDTAYPFLDSYWENEKRIPLKMTLDEKWAGFALINDHTLIDTNTIAIAEFYILPQYRKLCYGRHLAYEVFKTYTGQWEVLFQNDNLKGGDFWRSVISNYSETKLGHETILSFNNED